MEQSNYKLSEFVLSPFVETEETKEIKKYMKSLGNMDGFKDLKLYFVHFNDTDTLKKPLKLVDFYEQSKRKILSVVSSFLPYGGMYNHFTKRIMIFVDNVIKYGRIKSFVFHLPFPKAVKDPNSLNKICCGILHVMYHEKRHHMQKEKRDNSFESIMAQIEKNIRASYYGNYKYKMHHDSWYFEIDANNYGIRKTIDYYKSNPQDTHVDFDYLERLRKRYESDELTYDFDSFFTLYNVYREKIPFYSHFRNKLSNIFLNDKNMAWHKVLYGDNKRLKSVDEILSNPLISEVDPKFINRVLTSRYLNKYTNYDNLDFDTLVRLSTEFHNRLEETYNIVDNGLDSHIGKKTLIRIKNDIEYYQNTLTLLQSKTGIYNRNAENLIRW